MEGLPEGLAFELSLKDELTKQRGKESQTAREKNKGVIVLSGNCSGAQELRTWASPSRNYLCDLGQCILTSVSLVSSL